MRVFSNSKINYEASAKTEKERKAPKENNILSWLNQASRSLAMCVQCVCVCEARVVPSLSRQRHYIASLVHSTTRAVLCPLDFPHSASLLLTSPRVPWRSRARRSCVYLELLWKGYTHAFLYCRNIFANIICRFFCFRCFVYTAVITSFKRVSETYLFICYLFL